MAVDSDKAHERGGNEVVTLSDLKILNLEIRNTLVIIAKDVASLTTSQDDLKGRVEAIASEILTIRQHHHDLANIVTADGARTTPLTLPISTDLVRLLPTLEKMATVFLKYDVQSFLREEEAAFVRDEKKESEREENEGHQVKVGWRVQYFGIFLMAASLILGPIIGHFVK